MPKFNRQNKKKIDPRYFLNETIDPDTNADDSLELIDMLIDQIRDYSKELTGFRDHFGDMDELLQMSIQDLKNKLSGFLFYIDYTNYLYSYSKLEIFF